MFTYQAGLSRATLKFSFKSPNNKYLGLKYTRLKPGSMIYVGPKKLKAQRDCGPTKSENPKIIW